MKKKTKKRLIIVVTVIMGLMIVGGIGVANYLGYFNPGNGKEYSLTNVEKIENSKLANMHIIFLGSSVTEGMHSQGVSFVEFMAKRNDFTYTKEAKSGTTLVDNGKDSYVQRLMTIEDTTADLFICQLSTNDAQKKLPMGEISKSKEINDFDVSTVIGAMETIIVYSQNKWDVPVIFYTGTEFDNEQYPMMIDALYELQAKWDIGIIDLWNTLDIQVIDEKTYKEYMSDAIHPTRRGYLEWWVPQMETSILEYLNNK
ncbi:SGNH/GDSL hydrolase family protein [Anaerorhabdus sp.]|uniref:SGNH/GDSL hydrolase family protein n=1 Tax=Anaerorhabdus sp. TaxID=1872524 RepID=UPI002FCBCB1B